MAGDASLILRHDNVYGVIVEKDAGDPDGMQALRTAASRPTLPVWFVSFGDGIAREASGRSRPSSRAMRERPEAWAGRVAATAAKYNSMSVTYSSAGEYGNSVDIPAPLKSLREKMPS